MQIAPGSTWRRSGRADVFIIRRLAWRFLGQGVGGADRQAESAVGKRRARRRVAHVEADVGERVVTDGVSAWNPLGRIERMKRSGSKSHKREVSTAPNRFPDARPFSPNNRAALSRLLRGAKVRKKLLDNARLLVRRLRPIERP